MGVEELISTSLDILAGVAVVAGIIFFSMLAGLWVEGHRRDDDNDNGKW